MRGIIGVCALSLFALEQIIDFTLTLHAGSFSPLSNLLTLYLMLVLGDQSEKLLHNLWIEIFPGLFSDVPQRLLS